MWLAGTLRLCDAFACKACSSTLTAEASATAGAARHVSAGATFGQLGATCASAILKTWSEWNLKERLAIATPLDQACQAVLARQTVEAGLRSCHCSCAIGQACEAALAAQTFRHNCHCSCPVGQACEAILARLTKQAHAIVIAAVPSVKQSSRWHWAPQVERNRTWEAATSSLRHSRQLEASHGDRLKALPGSRLPPKRRRPRCC
ncbi:unnamed protein product [Effrenium voratum]|uniref:Uncharacterized protein n=1 Tax=Effrenium voratum TaxID=2562239 RepID=A0AA36MUM1_9DINO|nr:unnamed protein product [Effrenium voratum]